MAGELHEHGMGTAWYCELAFNVTDINIPALVWTVRGETSANLGEGSR
jgi:hypothetical protein